MKGTFSGQQSLYQYPTARQQQQQQSRRSVIECQQRGGSQQQSGVPSHLQGRGRIIMPGQEQASKGKLMMPGQHPGFKKYEKAGYKPPPPAFRPPPGFMDIGAPKPAELPADPKVLMDQLRSFAGHWHQLARFLPQLARAGYDTTTIEGETGLQRSEQDVWGVALQVYDSLKKSGEIDDSDLAHFNGKDGANLLYELRFVPLTVRPPAALYMRERDMNPAEAMVLGRAIKEHTRRSGEKEGFEYTPQDCMAFKYYRDAVETRKPEECQACVKSGLQHASSKSAVAKLRSMVEAPEEEVQDGTVKLSLMRLTKEEVQWKLVAVAGSLATATAANIRSCPVGDEYSVFRIFTESGKAEQGWVTLPRWNILALADEPCVLTVPELSKVDSIGKAVGFKAADRHKLDGPGLVVFDRSVGEPDSECHYLVEVDGTLQITAGGALESNSNCCGRLLYVCRPPKVVTLQSQLKTDDRMGPVEI